MPANLFDAPFGVLLWRILLALLDRTIRGTQKVMANSFVGIISPRGLELLLPETEHALPFLVRRAYRRRPTEAVCYWAVMQDSAAAEVRRQLQGRRREDAFLALRALADFFGTIPPPTDDDSE